MAKQTLSLFLFFAVVKKFNQIEDRLFRLDWSHHALKSHRYASFGVCTNAVQNLSADESVPIKDGLKAVACNVKLRQYIFRSVLL